MITKLTIYENYKFPEDRERDLKINEIIDQVNLPEIAKERHDFLSLQDRQVLARRRESRSLVKAAWCLQTIHQRISSTKKLCKDQCPQLYKSKLSGRFSEIKKFLEHALGALGEAHRLRGHDKDGNSYFDIPKLDS